MNKPQIDPWIFWPSLAVILIVTAYLGVNHQTIEPVLGELLTSITYKLDWAFQFLTAGIFAILIWLGFGRYGKIKLGGPGDQPEFSNFSWGAMLFCAGMGTSIMYWSMMEPIYYYAGPPFGIEPKSPEAAEWALTYGMFHWGLSAWALYALPTVTIAYSFFVRKQPSLKISTACSGVLGKHADGWLGKVIDILVIWSLVGGLGTSLGLGVPMISSVIGEVFGIEQGLLLSIIIIVIWTILYCASAYMGLYKGIQKLSDFNVYMALALVIFAFLVGPTLFILSNFTNSFGMMLQNFARMSFFTDPIEKGGFPQSWTVFYWAWFAATSPFMGLFVARISRGRTIRELIGGILLWGSLGGWLYFAVFGSYALHLEMNSILPVSDILNDQGGQAAVVAILKSLPLSYIVLPFFLVLGFIFLATSLDSATYILSAIATKELKDREEPARWHRLLWGVVQAVLAVSLLLIGGLQVVQTSTVIVSVPVIIMYVLLAMSLIKWLKKDQAHLVSESLVVADEESRQKQSS